VLLNTVGVDAFQVDGSIDNQSIINNNGIIQVGN
jgi:hypothetical protein